MRKRNFSEKQIQTRKDMLLRTAGYKLQGVWYCNRVTKGLSYIPFFFVLRFYLFIHERHRERGRDKAEEEAGSMQGA